MGNAVTNLPDAVSDIKESDIFTKEELLHFRKKLLEKKTELLDQTKSTIGSGKIILDSNEMKDEVDQASVSIEHYVTFSLLERCRKLLKEVRNALQKMEEGEYGYCEGTGEPIPKRRLEITPWARYNVDYKSSLEKHKKILNQPTIEGSIH